MKNILDLRNAKPGKHHSLGDRFTGKSKSGHTITVTDYYLEFDGKPYFGISGEMHFSRIPVDEWEDSIVKAKCGGINILATYVFWNVHEEEEGVFRWDGRRDLRKFLMICRKHGMMVILRVGPFGHGEMRNGGIPDWLYGKPFEVRSSDPAFLAQVQSYFSEIAKQTEGLLFEDDGPVIALQLDNEYMHSSAVWEFTQGAEEEWVPVGSDGGKYLAALRSLMEEAGLKTPFYTCTAWGGAATPTDQAVPVWGGYSYQPWLFYNYEGEHPTTPEYIFRNLHTNKVPKTYNFEPQYPPESMPYFCCEMMGGMTCMYHYRFQLPMQSIDAMANIKLGSGCNMLGYYMYRGGSNPVGKSGYLNEHTVPKINYDYQAAIGQDGQLRESWHRLRILHYFLRQFGSSLAEMETFVPEQAYDMDPRDTEDLRYSVRMKAGRGFVFIDNFQDHFALPDRREESVTVKLPGESITVGPFSIASGESAILPFNLELDGALLKYATAQPVIRRETLEGPVWYFMTPDGMEPHFEFDRSRILSMAGTDRSFQTVLKDGRQIRFEVMTRAESLCFYAYDVSQVQYAAYSKAPLLFDGNTFYAERREAEVKLDFKTAGAFRYVIRIPGDTKRPGQQTILRLRYFGDVGHLFAGGRMINDDFANGAVWETRIDPYLEEGKETQFVVYITPLRKDAKVNVNSSMAAQMEEYSEVTGALTEASLCMVSHTEVEKNNQVQIHIQ